MTSAPADTDLAQHLTAFGAALVAIDTSAALNAAEAALAAGADPVGLLVDVVGPSQREVGLRWQRGEWTVAAEHAATAAAVAATEAITRHLRRTVPVRRGHVVIACAEREWHALPAMMIECALCADGWRTTLLGASTSPLRLSQYLQDLGPDALAVSCSMLGSLGTTRRFVEAASAAGIPTLVGGPGFGPDPVRAMALGATAWAADARSVSSELAHLPAVVAAVAPLPADVAGEYAALELDHQDLAGTIGRRWTVPPELEIAEDAVHQTLHATGAAVLTGDPRPIAQTAYWIAELLAARQHDPRLIVALGQAAGAALRNHPLAYRLLTTHWPDLS